MGRNLAITVAVLVGGIGAIQLAGGAALGLGTTTINWLGVIGSCLGILQGFLPQIHKRQK